MTPAKRMSITGPAKVIFLDFDGVLNHRDFLAGVVLDIKRDEEMIDAECVARLNSIVERTGAVVVISSSWRYGRTIDRLQRILNAKGFTGKVAGATTTGFICAPRRDEIQDAIDQIGDNLVSFVIIDDDDEAEIPGHFVLTNFKVGLTDKHAENASRILGEITMDVRNEGI